MKLFSRTLLRWNEPLLFAARVRDRQGWATRGLLALAIFAAMMFGFFADQKWGARRARVPLAGAIVLSAFIGVFLTSLLDAPGLNKEVSIDEERISVFGNAGTVHSHANWKLKDVLRVRLYTPQEFSRSFGAMLVVTERGSAWLGVPAKVPAQRIAETLTRLGVEVILPGWEPAPEEERSPHATATPTLVATPTATARVETLDEQQVGQIQTPSRRKLAMAMEIVPLLVPLSALLGLVGLVAYRLLVTRGLVPVVDLAAGGGGLALLVGGLWIAGRYGSLAPALFMRAAARSVIELRPDALLNPRDPDAVFVSVVPRANWGKVMLNQSTDVGFLKVDPSSRCLLFEGDRERWRIPAQSLVSVGVESYVPLGKTEAPTGEGEGHQERYFLTVIQARVGEALWEAPVSKAPVEWRPRTNKLREDNAVALRDRVRDLLPSGWTAAES